jgi:serine/threonine-protein kinase
VHRDVKPGNVFVGSDGRVTILDLGIARPRQSALTQTGIVVGSPMYMAPEQITGADDLDARADIYALGVVLFEMLTGQPPFEAPSDFQLMQRHFVEPPPDPALLNPALPPEVGDALRRAMAKHRDERFSSATELYAALDAALAGASEPQAPHRLGTKPLPARLAPTPVTGPLEQAALRPSRAPWLFAAALALLAGASFAAWRLLHAEASGELPAPIVIAPPPATPPAPQPPPQPVEPAPVLAAAPAGDERPVAARRTGKIQISVTLDGKMSWGWVDLDGLRRGVTPLTLEAPPGTRVVRVSRPGFRDVEREVAVKPGALQKVVVALEPR